MRSEAQKDASIRPYLGIINVILATPERTGSPQSKVLSISQSFIEDLPPDSKRSRVEVRLALSFSDKDKVGTLQPHDDALIVTFRIGGWC